MHFVFETVDEKTGEGYNFINCADVNLSGIRRFTACPIFNSIFFLRTRSGLQKEFSKDVTFSTQPIEGKPYIVATGVSHSPNDWCGPDWKGNGTDNQFPDRKSLFKHIPTQYIHDLQTGRAFLLLDQSHEGYQVPWLWEWFHNNCEQYNISPQQIIYVTGNLDCTDQYSTWAANNNVTERMLTLPYAHFEGMIFESSLEFNRKLVNRLLQNSNLSNFKDHLLHKKKNLSQIKVYNALQKRPRAHRAWLLNKLYHAGLLQDGLNSMNEFKLSHTYFEGKQMNLDDYNVLSKMLPMAPVENPPDFSLDQFVSSDSGNYLQQFNEQIMLDTWVTVVSEASLGDDDGTCFISEKTFKPIACSHPFIIAGNKHSLKRLREMGYRTFSPFIDETYDSLSTWDRLDAIIKELVKIKSMTDEQRLSWYEQMEPIFAHNLEVFYKNSRASIHPAILSLKNYVSKTR